MTTEAEGVPIEEFIQALTSQFDRAQATMALKARSGLPLTFALKDIAIDLRAQVIVARGQVRILPAGPRDPQASTIHLAFTTITRPMIEENTLQLAPDDVPLHTVIGDVVTEEEGRRLEWAGIRTVSQLVDLEREGGEGLIMQVAQVPAARLRAALERASRPVVVRAERTGSDRLRIRGHNLVRGGKTTVRLDNKTLDVLEASEREIVVTPPTGALAGTLSVETEPGLVGDLSLALAPPSSDGATT